MLGHHEHTTSTCYCIFADQRLKICLPDAVTQTYKVVTVFPYLYTCSWISSSSPSLPPLRSSIFKSKKQLLTSLKFGLSQQNLILFLPPQARSSRLSLLVFNTFFLPSQTLPASSLLLTKLIKPYTNYLLSHHVPHRSSSLLLRQGD